MLFLTLLHRISSLPFCSPFPFFSVHFSHAGDLPNCERVKNWHNRLHTWHQRDSARWNTTDFLSNNLFFNPIRLPRTFCTQDVPKNVLEFHVFPGNWQFVEEILWVLDLDHPLPLFSWGHSWDIWVNWIATEWPQFIHCFSFCSVLMPVSLWAGHIGWPWATGKSFCVQSFPYAVCCQSKTSG